MAKRKVEVELDPGGKRYAYETTIPRLRAGSQVVVPNPNQKGGEQPGRVVATKTTYTGPVKPIIRKGT